MAAAFDGYRPVTGDGGAVSRTPAMFMVMTARLPVLRDRAVRVVRARRGGGLADGVIEAAVAAPAPGNMCWGRPSAAGLEVGAEVCGLVAHNPVADAFTAANAGMRIYTAGTSACPLGITEIYVGSHHTDTALIPIDLMAPNRTHGDVDLALRIRSHRVAFRCP
jgi:hypothetical protein